MFLENSRYTTVPTIETTRQDGRVVTALKLRALPPTPGESHNVKDNDQLDVLAHGTTGDGTRFWHIADANTELQANTLVVAPGRVIAVPPS